MFKFFKIIHEAYHRLGILLGLMFIFFGPGFIESFDRGSNIKLVDFINGHGSLIGLGIKGSPEFIVFIIYPLLYLIGYSILKIVYWLRCGFKKN